MKNVDCGLCGNQHVNKSRIIRSLLESNREVLLNSEETNGICYDGIIDEKAYCNSSLSVTVLLKETNGNDGKGQIQTKHSDWDYTYWLKHQQVNNEPELKIDGNGNEYYEINVFYQSTFKKLCHWLAILFELEKNDTVDLNWFLSNGKTDISKVRTYLKRVALVNLKKTWGKEKSSYKEIRQYVMNPQIRKILLAQLDILDSDIVLCCSPDVYWIATEIHGVENGKHIQMDSCVFPGKKNEMFVIDKTIYVKFYHPQSYQKTDMQYAEYAKEVFSWVLSYRNELINT